jgi:hypothetical protein
MSWQVGRSFGKKSGLEGVQDYEKVRPGYYIYNVYKLTNTQGKFEYPPHTGSN